ncbi:unnamed protein product [Albugo candida]|uniref:Uncharacterized protein n=1 Tax=Albugo candida TaxID=65357 RepID=A0A024G8P1_9STRA|nr:unnamed protein product [Albugo candida]|eukprot:CCI43128.1 unnamed protein product [Albugo candida]
MTIAVQISPPFELLLCASLLYILGRMRKLILIISTSSKSLTFPYNLWCRSRDHHVAYMTSSALLAADVATLFDTFTRPCDAQSVALIRSPCGYGAYSFLASHGALADDLDYHELLTASELALNQNQFSCEVGAIGIDSSSASCKTFVASSSSFNFQQRRH